MKKFAKNEGFTLVEVLVSLTLLTTALVPAFVLASNAVNLSTQIKNSLIASNLAQEGVEVIRAIRDANWFNDREFDEGLTICQIGCRVQWNSLNVVQDASNPLLKVTSQGLYQYDGAGTDSIFHRKITIVPNATNIALTIVSEVTWQERGRPKSAIIEYHLYNWLP